MRQTLVTNVKKNTEKMFQYVNDCSKDVFLILFILKKNYGLKKYPVMNKSGL